MERYFVGAHIVIAFLLLAVLYSYGGIIKSERSAREGESNSKVLVTDSSQRALNRDWWREINRRAMADDVRLQNWLRRGIQLCVVGFAADIVGIAFGRNEPASVAIVVAGVVLLAAGLIDLLIWTRVLGRQLRSQRSQ